MSLYKAILASEPRALSAEEAESLTGYQRGWLRKHGFDVPRLRAGHKPGYKRSPESTAKWIATMKRRPHPLLIHGQSKHPLFNIWKGMINRCENPKDKKFSCYGGRGIKVCERWHDIQNFITDMDNRPSQSHILERIDNNGDYGPDNCKWATVREQNNNQRRSVRITFNGRTQTMTQWCHELGIRKSTVQRRAVRARAECPGWESTDGVVAAWVLSSKLFNSNGRDFPE